MAVGHNRTRLIVRVCVDSCLVHLQFISGDPGEIYVSPKGAATTHIWITFTGEQKTSTPCFRQLAFART